MEYTKNYHLPQWKEDDRIMMRDFNAAMATLEKSLTTMYNDKNKPYSMGSVTITSSDEIGRVLVEFDFSPAYVIICAGSMDIVPQGGAGAVSDSYSNVDAFTHRLSIDLSGNYLRLSNRQSQVSSSVQLRYIAVR